MAKKIQKMISSFTININNYKINIINKDSSIIYRCKFCRLGKIKKKGLLFYHIKGHEKNCVIFKPLKKEKLYMHNYGGKNKLNNSANNNELIDYNNKLQINPNKIIRNMNKIIFNSNYLLLGKGNSDKIFIGKYAFFEKRLIGKGSFENTYFGYTLKNFEEVAIKINRENKRIPISPSLELEVLEKLKGLPGFPIIKQIYKYKNHEVIVQNLLGPSLKKLMIFYEKPFSTATICRIGIEILKRLKSLHMFNILHNDLKPSNFCWGLFRNNKIELKNTIFMIDFGLASELQYSNVKNLTKHNQVKIKKNDECFQLTKNRRGNLCFMSFEVLKGKLPSKKTEMQSFAYFLIFLFKLTLPWSNIESKTHEDKIQKIIDIHKKVNDVSLCQNLPYEIFFIVSDINKLEYNQTPNYALYIKVLSDLLKIEDKWNKKFFCWENLLSPFSDVKNKNKINKKNERKFKNLFEGYYSF